MARRKTQFEETAMLNNITWRQYYNRLKEIALSRFVWQNMPDTIDTLFFERKLFVQGSVAFFKDDDIGFLCLPYAYQGQLNVYNKPTKIRAYATGYQFPVNDQKDFTIIYNNYLRMPSHDQISMYALRLYNIDRVIDVNVQNQKTPILILCDEKQRLTFENLYKNVDGFVPRIFGDKHLDVSGIQILPTQSPYISDKLNQLKADYWNECLTYLGISNVTFQKHERMNVDEVNHMQGGAMSSRSSWLQPRKIAAEEINRKFGLAISVDWNSEIVENSVDNVDNSGGGYYE